MANYLPYKTKKFKLEKEALVWIKAEKKSYGGVKKLKVETNYNPGEPFPWTGVVLMKAD